MESYAKYIESKNLSKKRFCVKFVFGNMNNRPMDQVNYILDAHIERESSPKISDLEIFKFPSVFNGQVDGQTNITNYRVVSLLTNIFCTGKLCLTVCNEKMLSSIFFITIPRLYVKVYI